MFVKIKTQTTTYKNSVLEYDQNELVRLKLYIL